MYTPLVRFLFGFFGLALAVKFYLSGSPWSSVLILAGVGLVIWGYFRNGTVFISFQQVKKNNPQKAEKLLSKIRKPHLLSRSQRGYYHFTRGFIELSKRNLDGGAEEFTQALELGLRTDNDKAIALLNLSAIELERKNYPEAARILKTVKSLDHIPNLEPEIERISSQLNAAKNR